MMLINSFTTIRRFGLALCISLACLTACNDPEPAITSPGTNGERGNIPATWQKMYGSDPGNLIDDIAPAEDGGVFLTGFASLADSTTDLYLLKLDASGNQVWEARFGTDRSDAGRCVLATPDGGCIAAGYGGSGGASPHLYIVKVNRDGIKEWDSLYYLNSTSSMAFDIAPAHDGNYIITGIKHPYNGSGNALLMKIDPQGAIQWEKSFGDEGQYTGWSVTVASDGTIAITVEHISDSPFPEMDEFIIITDAGGNLIQRNQYPGTLPPVIHRILATSDGGFLATAGKKSSTSSYAEGAVIKLDKQGNELWRQSGDAFSSAAASLMHAPSDTYTLYTMGGWLININQMGQRQWYGFPVTTLSCKYDLAATLPDGATIIAGNTKDSYIGTDSRICVFRIDP